jgi:hypothetical protein
MSLIGECPDIENVSFLVDPQPGNPLGYRAVVWTHAQPDATDPTEQKRGLIVADAVQRFLRTNFPVCTGITYKRV